VKDKLHMETKPPVYGPLPILGVPVQVQCEGYKCMAYLDKTGQWIDLFTRKPLPRVLGVVLGG
jgi:hypothetical protein